MGEWRCPEHPFQRGTVVRHYGHQWPGAECGTATVHEAIPVGRWWEYIVDPIPERWPNAEEHRALCGGAEIHWADHATIPVEPEDDDA